MTMAKPYIRVGAQPPTPLPPDDHRYGEAKTSRMVNAKKEGFLVGKDGFSLQDPKQVPAHATGWRVSGCLPTVRRPHADPRPDGAIESTVRRGVRKSLQNLEVYPPLSRAIAGISVTFPSSCLTWCPTLASICSRSTASALVLRA